MDFALITDAYDLRGKAEGRCESSCLHHSFQSRSAARSLSQATVTVDDANDNCPVFQHAAPLVMYVSEGVAQIDILNLTASDIDIGDNGNVSYFINDTGGSLNQCLFYTGVGQ